MANKWAWAVGGLVAVWTVTVSLLMALTDTRSPFPITEITHQNPYVGFIGRECRIVADVHATAWNDFPDKTKIVKVTLSPPPGVRNRFVAFDTPLKLGQRIQLISAWQQFGLGGFTRNYGVSVPGAGLPEGIPIAMYMNADGIPDSRICEIVDK
jgi:hypothetical protein